MPSGVPQEVEFRDVEVTELAHGRVEVLVEGPVVAFDRVVARALTLLGGELRAFELTPQREAFRVFAVKPQQVQGAVKGAVLAYMYYLQAPP